MAAWPAAATHAGDEPLQDRTDLTSPTGCLGRALRSPEVLDRLCRAATHLLGAPFAFIAVVERGDVALVGCARRADAGSDPRDEPSVTLLARRVVEDGTDLVVVDAEARRSELPPGIADRFGACVAAVLRDAGGRAVGTFCVVDESSRTWSTGELEGLRDLAAAAAAEIERRDAVRMLVASEERLALALDGARDGLWDWHVPSGAVFFSPGWCRMLGYEPHEIEPHLGSWETLVHPDDWAVIKPALEPHLAGEIPLYACEHRMRRKDGTWAWILDRGRVMTRDADGRPLRVVGTHTDVTERRAMEELLRQSEQRYSLAARAAHNAIWDWDLGSGGVSWSPGLEEQFGYPLAGVEPSVDWWESRIHPADAGRVAESLRATVATQASTEWRETYRFRRADGTYAQVVDRGYLMRDAEGGVTRMIGSLEDVTTRTLSEERLRQARKMEAVGQLAGGVAHDFNNLLTAMSGNLELAQLELPLALPASHPTREHLTRVAGAVDRAAGLVRQLLAFGRRTPLAPRVLRLGALVHEAEDMLRRVIGEEIVIEVVSGPDEPLVRADASQMVQVVLNLAANARDAMLTPVHGHPGMGGTLTLETGRLVLTEDEATAWDGVAAGAHARLVVRDTGHGMDAGTLEHIFEPFFTTKPVGSGTGLGLATVFGIVRQAGGAIRVESAPNAGTTVTVLLPAAVDAAPAEPVPGRTLADASGGTLLLVEDEDMVRTSLGRLLERHGYRVLAARHGRDALALWQAERAAVTAVVTDLRMPEMGGRELVRRLHLEQPELPIVYLSGYSEDAGEVAREPWERFLEKPCPVDRLVATIRELVAAPA